MVSSTTTFGDFRWRWTGSKTEKDSGMNWIISENEISVCIMNPEHIQSQQEPSVFITFNARLNEKKFYFGKKNLSLQAFMKKTIFH